MKSSASSGLKDSLNSHGVVKDENDMAVEGATVMLFACFSGEIERSLGSTLTDRNGVYFISVSETPDHNELHGFKVRSGIEYLVSKGFDINSLIQAVDNQENSKLNIEESSPNTCPDSQELTGESASPGQTNRWPVGSFSRNLSQRYQRPNLIHR